MVGGQLAVDASNACIPYKNNALISLFPPLPTTVRGEPCILDGSGGKINNKRPVLLYGSGKLVIIRELWSDLAADDSAAGAGTGTATAVVVGGTIDASQRSKMIKGFVYRGHTSRVTCAKFSPSGCYVASGDVRGHLRVWSYDNDEHLCKLDLKSCMPGPIRDISWDMDSKRICIVGETTGGSSATEASKLCKVIQWDTGVTCGELGQHTRGRVSTCTFRKCRPFRIVTGGEDGQVIINGNTPFKRLSGQVNAHDRTVNCIRYSPCNNYIASVGGDKKIRLYDGKDCKCLFEECDCHGGAIYSCSWSSDSCHLLTCSADGTVKLWQIVNDCTGLKCEHVWDVSNYQVEMEGLDPEEIKKSSKVTIASPTSKVKTPIGGMQLGCAFINGNIPVAVGFNGQICILPRSPSLREIVPSMKNTNTRGLVLLTGHQGNISTMSLDCESGRLYTADTDGVIVEWNIHNNGQGMRLIGGVNSGSRTDPEPATLLGKIHKGAITSIITFMGGDKVLSVGWDDTLRISTKGVGYSMNYSQKIKSLKSQPRDMDIGTHLVVIVTVGGLVLVKDDHVICSEDMMKVSSYEATCVSVSTNDDLVCVGGTDGHIRVYNVVVSSSSSDDDDGCELQEIHKIENAHFKSISSISFSHDGKYLASADVRDVCVWNVKAQKNDPNKKNFNKIFTPLISKNRWCFHTQKITCLAWSPTNKNNNQILASGGLDDCIFIWNIDKKMKRIQYTFAHRGGITGLQFVNNNVLISTGNDGCICQWNIKKDVKDKFG